MADNGATYIIGVTCDYGPCSAAVRVDVDFAFGGLQLCLHHWREAEDMIVASSTFLGARVDTQTAVGS